MRFPWLVIVFGAACVSKSPPALVGGGGDLAPAGGDLAESGGECTVSGQGHYAIGGLITFTDLYFLGDNGWDKKIGRIVLGADHTDLPLDTILAYNGGTIFGDARGVFISFVPTADDLGRIIAQLVTFLGDPNLPQHHFTAVGLASATQDTFLVGVDDSGEVYCVTPGKTFDNGVLGPTDVFNHITAIRGTCVPANGGAFDVEVIGQSDIIQSAGMTFRRDIKGVTVRLSMTGAYHGMLFGLSHDDLSVSEVGDIVHVPIGSEGGPITKVRETRLCVGPGNQFNGLKLNNLHGILSIPL